MKPFNATICLFLANLMLLNQKGQSNTADLERQRSIFLRLHVASQTRNGGAEELFKHENQPIPPALSKNGMIRSGEKRDLFDCLPTNETISSQSPNVNVDAKVFDGPAFVHFSSPGTCPTFDNYVNDMFVPYIVDELSKVNRVDIVGRLSTGLVEGNNKTEKGHWDKASSSLFCPSARKLANGRTRRIMDSFCGRAEI